MRLLDVTGVGTDHVHHFGGGPETYDQWVGYQAVAEDGQHDVVIGYCVRVAYGAARKRVVVFVDRRPQAEFLGADDFASSGEVLCELKLQAEAGPRQCSYPDEPVPERYCAFTVVGLPTRVQATRVHRAWAVVAGVGDHRTMCALAGLRRLERRA